MKIYARQIEPEFQDSRILMMIHIVQSISIYAEIRTTRAAQAAF